MAFIMRPSRFAVDAPLLLDTYTGAAAAYSLRKLRTAYSGSAIRVRRSSDSAEQDIGFTAGGDLDESALTTFCGAGDGFVTTWYDQSTNARDATQSTAGTQPQIVSSGLVNSVGGEACVSFESQDVLTTTAFTISAVSAFLVANNRTLSTDRRMFLEHGTFRSSGWLFNYRGDNTLGTYAFTNYDGSSRELSYVDTTSPARRIWSMFCDATSKAIFQNGTSAASGAESFVSAANQFNIGSSVFGSDFDVHEVICYGSDQSSNRTGIEGNANTYWSVY